MTDSTERFSDRVDAYQKYRPGYPPALLAALLERTGLGAGAAVADVGSGTGIFTRQLLDLGLQVNAVEPNTNMRRAAETLLSANPLFRSIDATAEDTGLADRSLDLVTAAQAFHWFNNATTRAEFGRILKPGGKLALIWNKRDLGSPLQQDYHTILSEYAPEYGTVNHMNLTDDDIAEFFSTDSMEILHFDNRQQLDLAGLIGRLKSASYCPAENSPHFIPLMTELVALFDQNAVDGVIDFDYDTQLYLGTADSTDSPEP
jgi:ubiquinone/menaquinone biosynthesis C-methylase UbiE